MIRITFIKPLSLKLFGIINGSNCNGAKTDKPAIQKEAIIRDNVMYNALTAPGFSGRLAVSEVYKYDAEGRLWPSK